VYKKNGALSDSGDFVKVFSRLFFNKFKDRFVLPGATYSYYVTAVVNSEESQPSAPVEITLNPPPVPAFVYGKVTDETTGLNLPAALVKFIPESSVSMNFIWTDTSGNYSKPIVPGNYYIFIGKLGYFYEYYDNAHNIQTATLVTINPGDSVEYNFALAKFIPPTQYTLSGNISDENGSPVRATVSIFKMRHNSHFSFRRPVRTDSLGNYSFNVLENDTVVVFARPFDHSLLPEYYSNKSTFNEADRIGISGNVADINFVLEHKPVFTNGITGVVKNADDEAVMSNVVAFRKFSSSNHWASYAAQTDSLGVYSFNNLLPGEYILLAHPQGNYIPTYFTYAGIQTLHWRDADSVVVDSLSIVSGIDFTVLPRPDSGTGFIKGKLLASDGMPVNGGFIFAVDENESISNFAVSDVNGNYTISDLIPGSYIISSDKVEYLQAQPKEINLDFANSFVNNVNFTLTPQSVTSTEETPVTVNNYSLLQNYPNPFNPVTNISFTLPEKTNVTLTVFNILGREITTLVNGELNAGQHSVSFDASKLSSGIYFYRMQAGNFISTHKMTYLK
ncbi:MAG: T9SS type A sorting domain-containing protein, partial [Ignavibacteriaceae bacterium]|nr:T9SS type A sorting domain-containing protein [Ignavibacteriaceae bacterium]